MTSDAERERYLDQWLPGGLRGLGAGEAHTLLVSAGYALVDAEFVCEGEPRIRAERAWRVDVRAMQGARLARQVAKRR